MSWLRLQSRGALVVLVAWAGLAAAQSPQLPSPQNPPAAGAPTWPGAGPTAAGAPGFPSDRAAPKPPIPAVSPGSSASPGQTPERLVTVNEGGRSILCRVVQSWRLADGSTAHQLQAIESGEFITIIDDRTAAPAGAKGLAKRIFHWGLRNSRTPPPGAPLPPIPPGLMVDSGVVVNHEFNRPSAGGTELPAGTVASVTACPSCPSCAVATVPAGPDRPTSPYHVGNVGPGAFASLPAGTMPAAPIVIQPGMPTEIVSGSGPCTDPMQCAPPAPASLGAKIKGLFAAKSTTSEPSAPRERKIVSMLALRPRPEETPLVIATPPSSAEPAHTEVVVARPDSALAKLWRRPAFQAKAAPEVALAPANQVDILASPECLQAPPSTKAKANPIGVAYAGEPREKAAPKRKQPNVVTAGELPAGSQSVLAARNGLNGPIAFIPMQAPVVPQPWRAPLPPDPKTPEAPQLNAFVNAFSPPPAPRGGNGPQVYNPGAQAMGYGPGMPYSPPMGYGYPAPPMPPYAMAGAMPPNAMMNPYPPQGMPYGYPMPAAPVQPMSSPRQYQGPLPPNPFGTNVPVSYTQPMPSMQPMPGYMPPAPMTMPQAPAAWQIGQLVDVLRDSTFPAQREMAANALTAFDWRANPQVATNLTQAARQDPAPTVRAACVLNLMRMHVATDAVRDALQTLRTDADPRVRDAAEQAITRLAPAPGSARAN